jgi:pimeloyl-ACP methyl ester carboxylesterase
MASDNSSMVLLHGILMSGNGWQDVVPLLSDHWAAGWPSN